MASTIKRETAMKIYDAIAASPTGLDVEQLSDRVQLNKNTCLIYTRWLAKHGCVVIESEPILEGKDWVKNLYLAIKPPDMRTDGEKLSEVRKILRDSQPRKLARIREIL